MKYIIDTYGRFLLNGAAVAMILLLVLSNIRDADGNQGVLKIIGANLAVKSTVYAGYSDFEAYQSESMKGMPYIKYAYGQSLYAAEAVRTADFIKAFDAYGYPLEFRVLRVADSMGNSIMDCYDKASGRIRFPSEGIYLMKIAVKDAANKRYTCAIRIPVNQKE